MSTTRKNIQTSINKTSHRLYQFTGHTDLKYYLISEDKLSRLEEESGNSHDCDLAFFSFGAAIGLITTLLTANIQSNALFLLLVICATISCVVGTVKYLAYRKSKKTITRILKEIKKSKCSLEKEERFQ